MTQPPDDVTPTDSRSETALPRQPAARRLSVAGKTWLVSGLLLLVLGIVIGRTLARSSPKDERDVSDMATRTFEALEATKIAYSLHEFAQSTPPAPALPVPASKEKKAPENKAVGKKETENKAAGQKETGKKEEHALSALPAGRTMRLDESAIGKWRELANDHPNYASPWRELGLTLSLFHRPGALEAFHHIAAIPDKPNPTDKSGTPGTASSLTKRVSDQEAPLTHAQEAALWQVVYGTDLLDAKRAPELRTQIEKLNLGWFENVALAQLYLRTGQKALADKALADASASSNQISAVTYGQVLFALFGIFVLFLYGIFRLGEWQQRRNIAAAGNYPPAVPLSPPAYVPMVPPMPNASPLPNAPLPAAAYGRGAYFPTYVPPPTAPYTPLPSVASPSPTYPQSPVGFSYWSRGIAFIIYMVVFLVIALPLRLLRPYMLTLSDGALLRLSGMLQILLYVPIVWITLVMLRRLVAAETPDGRRPTWRETLEGIGLFSRRPWEDIGAGVVSYTMAFPVFLALSALSAWIFRAYHTPINPVEVEMMVSQSRFDQILMLIQAAVAAPIVEEMMFRGLLFPALRQRWGAVMGIVLSSACFALVHPNLPGGFLPLWTLGVAFAMTYQRRGSLLPNIVMHGMHNAFVTITLFTLFAK